MPNIRKEPPYDVMADFTPVTFIGDNSFFIVVHPSVPAKTIPELIAYAKSNPNTLNYPSANTYAIVATGMFAASNGIVMHSVPYKSEPDAMPDLLSGRVHVMFGTSTNVGRTSKEGKLRVLATTLNERSALMPEAPSFPESGSAEAADRPVVRARRPRRTAERNRHTHEQGDGAPCWRSPRSRRPCSNRVSPRSSSTPEALTAYMKEQLAVWKTALKAAGLEPQ